MRDLSHLRAERWNIARHLSCRLVGVDWFRIGPKPNLDNFVTKKYFATLISLPSLFQTNVNFWQAQIYTNLRTFPDED